MTAPATHAEQAPARAARSPRAFVISLVLALVLAVGFVVLAVRAANRSTSSLGMRSALTLVVYPPGSRHAPAPVALARLGGGAPVRVGGAVGHPTVVNFFASWCPICRQELGTIAAVARSSRVPCVGIDTDDD
ncbi:MAG TPA: TlpA disulfide reductase family protein, partial [Acidimicrobiales bacterium]|nr:TlpA disulfide reductase family protein [Acidimicrobiales bacterium]